MAAFLVSAGVVAASAIEERVLDHVEQAAVGGLQPEDFHHLVFAFYWRDTLPDPTVVERALDPALPSAGRRLRRLVFQLQSF